MKKILVIEDEAAINDLICMNLEIAGYEPTAFFDGEEFSDHLKEQDNYHLALLDIMLPKDGFVLLEELKAHNIPVIYLTAKGDLPSKVKGLRSGAEDYIVKPFEMLELLVRIDKVLNRFQVEEAKEIYIKDVVINEKKRIITKAGKEITLQPMEFDCLLAFWKYRNRVITREQILNILWGCDFEGATRTVDVHVGNIRKKLDFSDVIITVPRVGYRMEVL